MECKSVGFFDRLFGKGREVRSAQKAELRGDLAKAAELYGLCGAMEDAARVMLLRGDAESDVRQRMVHYTQALATAPEGTDAKKRARVKRAELLVTQFGGASAVSSAAKHDLLTAARDLEAAGEAQRAAEVYRMASDSEGEARALTQAGDVEKLEFLLSEQEMKERTDRSRLDVAARVELLLAGGKRREALAAADALAKHDPRLAAEKASLIRGRRVEGPIVPVELEGKTVMLVLGDEVIIGRTEGTLHVPSHAVSRQHVKIVRENGAIVVRDLGSRNGTQLRGMDLVGALPMGDGLDLQLGKEVRLAVKPADGIDGARIELAGTTYVAPLGPATLREWQIEVARDGWLELVSTPAHPAYLGDVQLDARATLLTGDEISDARSGPVVLKIGSSK
jgi:hypothetical protein